MFIVTESLKPFLAASQRHEVIGLYGSLLCHTVKFDLSNTPVRSLSSPSTPGLVTARFMAPNLQQIIEESRGKFCGGWHNSAFQVRCVCAILILIAVSTLRVA